MNKTEEWRTVAMSKEGRCMLIHHPDEGYAINIEKGGYSAFRRVSLAEGLDQIEKWDAPDDKQ